MPKPIRKAILPVAGLGTRFLPATKAVPKEMLPVVDRPVVQHVVDEALAAGIEHIVFVTGRNKAVIEDHFDRQFELERTLQERGKQKLLEELGDDTPKPGTTSFTRQQLPLGLGHAVWCARDIIADEPFALLLPDMLHFTNGNQSQGCLSSMVQAYEETGGNVLSVYEVPDDQTNQYGIVGIDERGGKAQPITQMVEKPARGQAPSNLAISGRYILQPSIFDLLEKQDPGAGGEIQLTDAMLRLNERERFFAVTFEGSVYDCGSKIGFLMANVAYALSRPDIEPAFRAELETMLAKG